MCARRLGTADPFLRVNATRSRQRRITVPTGFFERAGVTRELSLRTARSDVSICHHGGTPLVAGAHRRTAPSSVSLRRPADRRTVCRPSQRTAASTRRVSRYRIIAGRPSDAEASLEPLKPLVSCPESRLVEIETGSPTGAAKQPSTV